MQFNLQAPYKPTGDQPEAIIQLNQGIRDGLKHQVLLGATGTGKTFTIANVIQEFQKPTLVLAHNKTLVAQLYAEFREFFPDNAVEYFTSYYDYYQPEAYVPRSDTYIEKESSINEQIDRMRHSATRALFERRDVVIVASVSCIYGLGSPEAYYGMLLLLETGQRMARKPLLRRLVDIHYRRKSGELERGTFRVHGDEIELFPPYGETALRIVLEDDVVVGLADVDPLFGDLLEEHQRVPVYPGSHYVTTDESRLAAIESIKAELDEHLGTLQPLIEEGGYIPTVDHTVPPDVSWPNFQHYMESKARLLSGKLVSA